MTKVLLVGHYGFTNRGCEAIVRGTLAILARHTPGADITLVSTKSDFDQEVAERSNLGLAKIVPTFGDNNRSLVARISTAIRRRLVYPSMSHIDYVHRRRYRESDVVISIGGDNFSDDYGSPMDFFATLVQARRAGAMTAIWGASVGPFHTDVKRWTAIMRNVDLIAVRERCSYDYLAGLGIRDNVRLVSDPAFLMEANGRGVPEIQRRPGRLVVGVGISGLLLSRPSSRERYFASSVALLRHIHSQLGAETILVPHVTGGGAFTDDMVACRDVWKVAFPDREPLASVPNLNAPQLKALIGQCDLFVGARTHSTIASLSQAVPTLSIGYSIKAFGINEQVLGTDRWVLPTDSLTEASLCGAFDSLAGQRDALREQLVVRLPAIRAAAMAAGEYLEAALARRSVGPLSRVQ